MQHIYLEFSAEFFEFPSLFRIKLPFYAWKLWTQNMKMEFPCNFVVVVVIVIGQNENKIKSSCAVFGWTSSGFYGRQSMFDWSAEFIKQPKHVFIVRSFHFVCVRLVPSGKESQSSFFMWCSSMKHPSYIATNSTS